ncbi:uncharacterized protein PGTG_15989 [Puccinia graminis f. sp. tritici CRL 75-36-700-3]|uniref:Uncharacterized protein n=1 Tax=Puccinia graminis f. sp. tritici (strain CRL 75-36-700-3 / race SCCL) TaxID=418459 RepID=E3L0L3_PUCGT|nr:uncharacterized protein PGTG_15989 [Puccinia graminis f. sp. tritici CRL 75-36-700-3]EFP90141.2 hypothetical protein PGTG_15989 [Puccinia graminis f. sp. tritici CRL 75-36-700-3]
MLVPDGKSSAMRWYHLYLAFLSLASVSAFLEDLEYDWRDQGPFAELGDPINYPGHSTLQSPLTGQQLHKWPSASPVVDGLSWPDLQVETPRLDEEPGSRKRKKHSHAHLLPPRETALDSGFMSCSSHPYNRVDSGNVPIPSEKAIAVNPTGRNPLVRNDRSLGGDGEVNCGQTQTQAEALASLFNSDIATTAHPSQSAEAFVKPSDFRNRKQPRFSKTLDPIERNHIQVTNPFNPSSGTTVPIVYEYIQAMSKRLHSRDLRFSNSAWTAIHATLPLCCKLNESGSASRTIRIIDSSRQQLRRYDVLESLYRNLISMIHDLHLERLNTPVEHIMHVRNIFDRLNGEILNPANGVPLLGTSNPTAKGWKDDFKNTEFGHMQERLAIYFSDGTKAQLPSLASDLIESYYDCQESDESAIRNRFGKIKDLEELNKIRMDPYLQDRFYFLYNIPATDATFQKFLSSDGGRWLKHHPNYDVFHEASWNFENALNSQPKIHRTCRKVNHAVLRIAFLSNDESKNNMRVLAPPRNLPYSFGPFLSVYNHLIKAVELIHLKHGPLLRNKNQANLCRNYQNHVVLNALIKQ